MTFATASISVISPAWRIQLRISAATERGRKIGAGQSVGALRPSREALGELHDSLAERARLAAANPTHRFRYHTHAYFVGTALATFKTRLSSCRGLTERRIGRG